MEIKRRRKQELKEKKSHLKPVTFVVLWLTILLIIIFVDPRIIWAIPLLLVTVFLAVTFTGTVALRNPRRGVLIGLGVTLVLALAIINMATPVNVILLSGALAAFEFYYSRM